VQLAKGGSRVWALDASAAMVRYAARLASEAGAAVEVVLGDMTEFRIEVGWGMGRARERLGLAWGLPGEAAWGGVQWGGGWDCR
jgi:hypothetical protein